MTAQDPVEQAIVEALRAINPSQYSDIDARLEPILRDLVKQVREPLPYNKGTLVRAGLCEPCANSDHMHADSEEQEEEAE